KPAPPRAGATRRPAAPRTPAPPPAERDRPSRKGGQAPGRRVPDPVSPRPSTIKKASQVMERFVPAPRAPASPGGMMGVASPARSGPRDGTPVTSPERFEQAVQLARLAASHGMFDLSFRA